MKKIIFTVTNDLSFDQRMNRICSSLANEGYSVTLVGRKMKTSVALKPKTFHQKRLSCFFSKGPFFYAEYNIRLFFWLVFQKADCICAIDLDTILPCLFVSQLKKTKRVYDAHELFCEMKEVVSRPSRYKLWKWIEKFSVPAFKNGYTVSEPIAQEFNKMYGVNYEVLRNVAVKALEVDQLPFAGSTTYTHEQQSTANDLYFLYQGAVNEGRCFESLIPAMKFVDLPLYIYGDGNFLQQTKKLIEENHLQEKVFLKGKLELNDLQKVTSSAFAGITLFEKNGLSNYLSLANRFFDYLQAGIPQLCVNYPAYKEINQVYEVALLIPETTEQSIAEGLNLLLHDVVLYNRLQENCKIAREELNWQHEEKKLIRFYHKILG